MKQNLQTFTSYLSLLNHRFSIIGVSGSCWTDATVDLYNSDGYALVKMHRFRGTNFLVFSKTDLCYIIT